MVKRNKKKDEVIPKEEMVRLGSTSLIPWMDECMETVHKRFEEIYKQNMSVFHIEPMDIESFKNSVEEYQKAHPEAKIKATAFMISSDNPEGTEYNYESN